MLASTQIQRRQSEVRQALATMVPKESPTADELRGIEVLEKEYSVNETRLRCALISESEERSKAGADLETRESKQYSDLVDKFEVRQVALALDEGKALEGETAEVVQEMRAKGTYAGVPVPWGALERRSGETIASGVMAPKFTAPVIDRLFPDSVAVRMGTSMINIDSGTNDYPVTSSAISAGWANSETGNVAGPTQYTVGTKSLAPDQTLGVTMTLTRKSLKQAGPAIEDAVRRDMGGAIQQELDRAIFLGADASGEPPGIFVHNYGIHSEPIGAAASWAAFRSAIVRFMTANAAGGPGSVKVLIRPEVYDSMDDQLLESTAVSEWDRFVANVGIENVVMTSNALAFAASPGSSDVLLTTSAGGIAPIFVGLYGGVDLIRDVYTKAASGSLLLTGLVTMDLTVARPQQLQILTGVE
jgi:HK97 family phage major capsid protein